MAENRDLAVILKLVADQFQSELKKSGGMVGEFNKFISDWKTQLTATTAAIFAIAKSTANYGDELVKMGQRLGTTVEDTARLQHAAKLADTDLRGLSTTVGFLAKQMLDAAQGNKDAQQGFASLGISVTTANGQLKGTTDILVEISDKFRLMPDGPEKLGMAMQVLGKSAKENLPFLNSNLREAFHEAGELGLVMDTKAARAAERFNDELTKLQGAIRGVTNDLGTALIPTFDVLTHALTTIITDARKATEALTGLGKIEAPQVGVVQPEGGGRRRLVMPAPSAEAIKGFATGKFFSTPEEAAAKEKALAEERRKHGENEERLAKAKLEIFQSQNRALEIQARLQKEARDAAMAEWETRANFVQVQESRLAALADAEENARIQESHGRRIVRETQEFVTGREQEQLGRQIVQQTQAELAQIEQLKLESRTFFDEWADGMKRYVQDTKSNLGLGADMARRTFQTMEQSARTFFFDVMEGRVKSLKDVFEGLLQFVRQIASQIAGQLITRQIVGMALGSVGGVPAFATGGSFLVGGFGGTDSQYVPIRATPGERVTVETPGQQQRAGAGGVLIQINNYSKSEVQAQDAGRGPDGRQMVYIAVRDAVRAAVGNGDMDRTMNQRFGLSPSPGRR